MDDALVRSRTLLCLITPRYLADTWTKHELIVFSSAHASDEAPPIVPVLVRPAALPPLLRSVQYFDLTNLPMRSTPGSNLKERRLIAAMAEWIADLISRAPQSSNDLDKLDLAFGPEHQMSEVPTPSVLDGQWHDAATKLDLAKAYMEMGDAEGAREILQEVLHEGAEPEKDEAQVLLAKLA